MNDRCEIGNMQAAGRKELSKWSALVDAEQKAQSARSRWRRVMFDWPKFGAGTVDLYEAAEAAARRELLEADQRLHELQTATAIS